MTPMIKLLESPAMMWLCGFFGDGLCIVGIITAALNKTIAGFTPITWILLAMVFYMYFVISMLARILATKVGKTEGL